MSVADSITNALLRFGRPMTLRRLTWAGEVATPTDVTVYGVTEGPLSQQLISGQSAPGTINVTFSNAQIAAASWPGPPQKLDQLIIDDGQVRSILAVETKYLGTQVLVFVTEVLPLSYDRDIRIERRQLTFDAYNQPVEAWVTLATVIASKIDLSDEEKLRAAQVGASITTRFQIRWEPAVADVNATDRIVLDGRVYDIVGVKEIGLRIGLEISATAAADGDAG